MALNSVETIKSCVSGETGKQVSKPSFGSKRANEGVSRIPKSLIAKQLRVRSKTADGADRRTRSKLQNSRPSSAEAPLPLTKISSDTKAQGKTLEREEKKNAKPVEKPRQALQGSLDTLSPSGQGRKKIQLKKKTQETVSKRENSSCREGKLLGESPRKPSEIPKLKSLSGTGNWKNSPKTSKLSVRAKHSKSKNSDSSNRTKKPIKEEIEDNKLRGATKENFSNLIPLCETELKKMTDTWLNTIYCSLSTRTNLVKLLFQEFPHIDRSQFNEEDDILLHYLSRAKNYNKTEEKNLMHLVRSLVGNRNKVREKYCSLLENREIAKAFNHNWRALTKKIADLEEEAKQLQDEIPQLEKKKAEVEEAAKSKIENMEATLSQKEDEIKKLADQLNVLKQRENAFKGNILMKVEEYKDIRAEAVSLKNVEKEFDELKERYAYQKEMFEKKIKDLEMMLEEKKKILERERVRKRQLQGFLSNIQTQQKQLYRSIGKEQVDYVVGRASDGKNKRRELLWVSAIKLVLKGFILQMKRLEKERNKMLLELNSNDLENFNNVAAAVLQKEIFMKSIRNQMNSLNRASDNPQK